MSEKKFIVIGIADSRCPWFPPETMELIRRGKVFSGGRRHREVVGDILPRDCEWINVTLPLEDVFGAYERHDEIVVFASGDPWFYGFAVTLRRRFPSAEIIVIPDFNSLQTLAHRIGEGYGEMVNVSLTGRDWKNLDAVLMEDCGMIGVLTDRRRDPGAIARRLLYYGYDNYVMWVGENLGNEERERVATLTLEEAAGRGFEHPNCVILRMQRRRHRYFGLPDDGFAHLDGRINMITKMPVRLVALSMLGIPERTSMWDVGFCTGSVSIEAKLRNPRLDITAFEKREESMGLLEYICRRFGTPGITGVKGDFLDCDLDSFLRPDAVFIGGHGGRLREMVEKINGLLLPGGVMVFNSVSEESKKVFEESVAACGREVCERHTLQLDSHNPITIIKAI